MKRINLVIIYVADDGLAGRIVEAIAVAPDGVVWFGTYDGASRFDGKSWTTFREGDGLPDDLVGAVAIAPDGAVWFGTEYGVSRYLPPQ